jgi:hypothetical protein
MVMIRPGGVICCARPVFFSGGTTRSLFHLTQKRRQ